MTSRIIWTLVGACAAVLLILAMTGFIVGGGVRYLFPTAARQSSTSASPQPIIVPSPTRAGPISSTPSSGGGVFP
jgi:hypothetical protein